MSYSWARAKWRGLKGQRFADWYHERGKWSEGDAPISRGVRHLLKKARTRWLRRQNKKMGD